MIDFLFKKFSSPGISFKLIIGVIMFYLAFSISWGLDSTGEKLVITRYVLFVFAGFYAFIIPHLLFPDARRFMMQSLNLSKKNVLNYIFRKLRAIILIQAIIILIINFPVSEAGFLDGGSVLFNIAYGLIITAGLFILSVIKYSGIGGNSQAWQEGDKGAKVLESMKQIGVHSAMPSGSYPSLFITTFITAGGMLLVVFGAWLSGTFGYGFLEILPGFIVLFYAIFSLTKAAKIIDRLYYHTHSFYSELFLNPKAVRDNREPVKTEALYWVPTRWKAAVWFSLVQLDRKHPLGRILIVGHLILWTLFYAGTSDMVIYSAVFLLILSKSAFVFRLANPQFAPLNFQYRLMSPADWVVARLFINLRWIPLLTVSLWIVSLFSTRVDWSFIGTWILIDVVISFLTAYFATLRHEFKLKKIYA